MKGLDKSAADAVGFRTVVTASDPANIRYIVESTGFFSDAERDVAVELADERLAKGEESGYHFIFAQLGGETVGYACFGPIPCTTASWDLYWIAVHERNRGGGLGRRIMEMAEAAIREMGGTRVYVDTSSREQYAPTRGFYESCGYLVDALQEDFYAPGDSKVIYVKKLQR